MPRGVELDKIASITRDKHTKIATLHIDTIQQWSIFAGCSVRTINADEPLLSGIGAGNFQLPVSSETRSYFKLVVGRDCIIIAEKILPLSGAFNFRDLGGIKLKGNRRVKWGKLFRADELTNLSNEDVEYIGSIPITSVIDFRAESEMRKAPDKLPLSARFKYPMAITPGAMRTDGIQTDRGKASFSSQMRQMNRLYVSDPACIRAYRIMFTIIQNNLSAPIIYHCSAGKDRTGMATALILFALGASEETVIEDYMLSKSNIADKYTTLVQRYPRAEPIFTVKRSYIMAGINQMKKDHGSVMNFLTRTLKADIPRIRRLYLEPVKK